MNRTERTENPDAEIEYLFWSQMIDHALLRPNIDEDTLTAGIRLARAYQVASVCILPHAVQMARNLLWESKTRPSTTIGFPHGGHAIRTKEAEALVALHDGAEELDMVVNVSKVLSGDWSYVRDDIRAVLIPTREQGKLLKVIFENAYLDDEQKKKLCAICDDLRVDWVKTSTGFGPGGATRHDVELMRAHVGPHVQVKAAGGIRTFSDLKQMQALGATRCGSSQTAGILDELRVRLDLPPLGISATDAGPRPAQPEGTTHAATEPSDY